MTIARPLCLSLFLSLLQTTKTNIIKWAEKITKCDLFWFEQIICDLNLAGEISMVTEFLAVRFCVTCVLFFCICFSHFFCILLLPKTGVGGPRVSTHVLQPVLLPCWIPGIPVSGCIYTEGYIFILEDNIYENTSFKHFKEALTGWCSFGRVKK